MCLKLSYVEARLWRDKAHRLISRSVAATKTIDPLLTSAGKLSEVVSVVDGIKKRHGLLIEDALIAAINFVPGWTAHRGVIPRGAGKVFKTDCVAYNRAAKTAYLFECKRQYTFLDGDAKKAVDGRLDEIAKLFPAFATSQGWSVTNQSSSFSASTGPRKGTSIRYTIAEPSRRSSRPARCVSSTTSSATPKPALVAGAPNASIRRRTKRSCIRKIGRNSRCRHPPSNGGRKPLRLYRSRWILGP